MEQTINSNIGVEEWLTKGGRYYEIRLESIGGLGANLCGKMLGELGLRHLGFNSSSFSSYGSEKTGTPVKGHIRYCKKEKEIRVHYPVVHPNLLVVFHQALLQEPSVYKGCGEETVLLAAMEAGNALWEGGQEKEADKEKRKQCCRFAASYGIEAQRIARETHSRMNVVMLGAVLRLMGRKDWKEGEQICKDTLGKKYPDALSANLEGLRRGYEEVQRLEKKSWYVKKEEEQEWGYETAPLGGINPRYGSTVTADLSPSRQGYVPLFQKERCINCGLCYSTCPDMVFQFQKGTFEGREMMVNQGLDYYHCKGCLRCVNVCPVNALVAGVEAEHPQKEHFVLNRELLRIPENYEKQGADAYVTSESFLTQKRVEGGEV